MRCSAARSAGRARFPTPSPTPARWRRTRSPRRSCACWPCRARAHRRAKCSTCSRCRRSPRASTWTRRPRAAAGLVREAGARWGLDAAHRERLGAPADRAYTWAWALDRLLLGHASGDDDDIAGVAPWPELEGSAIGALDCLLHGLRARDAGSAPGRRRIRRRVGGSCAPARRRCSPQRARAADAASLERLRALGALRRRRGAAPATWRRRARGGARPGSRRAGREPMRAHRSCPAASPSAGWCRCGWCRSR